MLEIQTLGDGFFPLVWKMTNEFSLGNLILMRIIKYVPDFVCRNKYHISSFTRVSQNATALLRSSRCFVDGLSAIEMKSLLQYSTVHST
jgi:hypothetical protein